MQGELKPPTREFWLTFQAKLYELFGAVEIADDFLAAHPEFGSKMRDAARFHYNKGGPQMDTAKWGAEAFYQHEVKPVILKDRYRSQGPQ